MNKNIVTGSSAVNSSLALFPKTERLKITK